MLLIEDKITQIDNQLNEMAKAVQLDETRYNKMITSYEAIKNWIESDEKFFKPFKYEVYPHGSVRIFTTVKPIGKDEFDLDVVFHFKNNSISHSPFKIYTELKRRLNENSTYKKMLETKSRVLRLNYSGDYHMDLMPGIQESLYDENKIKIPDRDLGRWVSSNPRGYANWFIEKANLSKMSVLEKAIRAEKIQVDDFNNKKPLQRAVQLIKRYRDIYFQNDDSFKPSSIILTTIAGQFYSGEESIFETIDNIISKIKLKFNYPSRIKVLNPVNQEEDFTDKWDDEPRYYEAFKKFVAHLYSEWQMLKKDHGIIEENRIFKGLFGSELVEKIQMREANEVQEIRKKNNLGVNRKSGFISTSLAQNNSRILKNTFYGDEKIK